MLSSSSSSDLFLFASSLRIRKFAHTIIAALANGPKDYPRDPLHADHADNLPFFVDRKGGETIRSSCEEPVFFFIEEGFINLLKNFTFISLLWVIMEQNFPKFRFIDDSTPSLKFLTISFPAFDGRARLWQFFRV